MSDPVGSPGERLMIAYGERASVPTAMLNQLAGDQQQPYTDVCLRVWDSDDYFDDHCTVWPVIPGPPPALGCTDVGISWANTYRFRRIVERAGLIDAINDYPTNFTMIIPTNALLDEVEVLSPGLEEWALESASNATAFAAYFAEAAYYPWSSLEPLTLWGIPTIPQAVDRGCGNGNPGPQRTMHIIGPKP